MCKFLRRTDRECRQLHSPPALVAKNSSYLPNLPSNRDEGLSRRDIGPRIAATFVHVCRDVHSLDGAVSRAKCSLSRSASSPSRFITATSQPLSTNKKPATRAGLSSECVSQLTFCFRHSSGGAGTRNPRTRRGRRPSAQASPAPAQGCSRTRGCRIRTRSSSFQTPRDRTACRGT
jgi:hypothetical protein